MRLISTSKGSDFTSYKYYSTQRPIDLGTFPKPPGNEPVELVFYDDRRPVENGTAMAYGELLYESPLTAKELEDYELRPSRDNPDIRERMIAQAQAVGAWEVRNGVSECKRLTVQKPGSKEYLPKRAVTVEALQRAFDLSLKYPTLSRSQRPPRKTGHKAR